MTGFVEVNGPESLTALVDVLAPAVATVGDVVTFDLAPGVSGTAQFDAVDADTWPYLVSVDADGDPSQHLLDFAARLRPTGWTFRVFVDDDRLIAEF